jgi:hypothetical protein
MSERERQEEVLDEELAAALRSLPRERQPSALLEERTVTLLRQGGMLGRRPHWLPAGWWAAGLAASIALFACGMAVGLWIGARQTAAAVAAQQRASREELAAVLERTGSAYVTALARLAETNVDRGAGDAEARDVALQILHQAANEVVRLAPNDPVAVKILQGLDHAERQREPAPSRERRRQIVWF